MSKQKPFQHILQNLSDQQVRRALSTILEEHRNIRNQFLIEFADKSGDSTALYSQLISDILKSEPARGGLRYTAQTDQLAARLAPLLDQFDEHIEVYNFLDAFNICKPFLLKIPVQIDRSEDSNGSLQAIIYAMQDRVLELYQSIHARELKSQVLEFIFEVIQKYADSDLNLSVNLCNNLETICSPEDKVKFHDVLVKLSQMDHNVYFNEFIKYKIAINKLQRATGDASAYLLEHKSIRSIHLLFIDQAINRGDYERAIQEIQQAKEALFLAYKYSNTEDYDKRLQAISRLTGNKQAVIDQLIENYLHHDRHMSSDWQNLKAHTPNEDWSKTKQIVLKKLNEDSLKSAELRYKKKIQIHIEEDELNEAFQIFQEHKNLNLGFIAHFDSFKDKYFESSLEILKVPIMEWANKKGRENYRRLAEFLQSLTHGEKGQIYVRQVVKEILIKYPHKSGLREELMDFII